MSNTHLNWPLKTTFVLMLVIISSICTLPAYAAPNLKAVNIKNKNEIGMCFAIMYRLVMKFVDDDLIFTDAGRLVGIMEQRLQDHFDIISGAKSTGNYINPVDNLYSDKLLALGDPLMDQYISNNIYRCVEAGKRLPKSYIEKRLTR